MTGVEVIERVQVVLSNSGLSNKDFAEQIGIDGPKLTKVLTGKRRLTSLELALIATVGNTTVDWLLTGNESHQFVLAHRAAQHSVTAGDLVGRETIELLVERAEGLEFLGRPLPEPKLPDRPRSGGWLGQARSLAESYLQELGEPIGGLSNPQLIEKIEACFGIDVVVTDLPDGCDGLSFSGEGVRVIVLATSDAPFRQRFTLAHEVAHIAFDDSRNAVIEERLFDLKSERERRADAFAAAFLASSNEIRRALNGRSPVHAFDDLVLSFQVSPVSMSWRLLNENLIDADEQRSLASSTARSIAMRNGQAAEHTSRAALAGHERPAKRLVDAYLDAYQQGLTTLRPAASLLGKTENSLEEYFLERASADDGPAIETDR